MILGIGIVPDMRVFLWPRGAKSLGFRDLPKKAGQNDGKGPESAWKSGAPMYGPVGNASDDQYSRSSVIPCTGSCSLRLDLSVPMSSQ